LQTSHLRGLYLASVARFAHPIANWYGPRNVRPGERWRPRDRYAPRHRRSLWQDPGSVRLWGSIRQRCRQGFSNGGSGCRNWTSVRLWSGPCWNRGSDSCSKEFSGRSRPADGHRRLPHSHRSTAGRRCPCITIWKQSRRPQARMKTRSVPPYRSTPLIHSLMQGPTNGKAVRSGSNQRERGEPNNHANLLLAAAIESACQNAVLAFLIIS
jgi:hypothetical protein